MSHTDRRLTAETSRSKTRPMIVPASDAAEFSAEHDAGDVAQLFELYGDKLRRTIALRLDPRLLSKVDSDDLLQDAFVDATRRIHQYLDRPAVPVFVWLRQIALQTVIDAHRRYLGAKMRRVTQEVPLHQSQVADASSALLVSQLADSLTSPSRCAVRREMLQDLRDALTTLSEMDQEVLVLRHLEELSNTEVAQVLGIDRFAASKRYLRALERLRRVLPVGVEEDVSDRREPRA
jgi:RNA polymerase sigma-70 factor (ECF subfamily)